METEEEKELRERVVEWLKGEMERGEYRKYRCSRCSNRWMDFGETFLCPNCWDEAELDDDENRP